MQSVIEVFNFVLSILKQVINGFMEFFNSIPDIFNTIGSFFTSLFPTEITTYLLALIPIIITLVIIKFVRG